jgi:hypothetical protein
MWRNRFAEKVLTIEKTLMFQYEEILVDFFIILILSLNMFFIPWTKNTIKVNFRIYHFSASGR